MLHNKMDQEAHENFSCVLRKNLIWGDLIFLGNFSILHWFVASIEPDHWYYYLNSQDMISFLITSGSLNSQALIRILKQSGHDFSGKQLY